MKTYLGISGLDKTWQEEFPPKTECVHCKGEALIGFVSHEDGSDDMNVCNLHENNGGNGGDFWPHDVCAVATYFCTKCLRPTSLFNQA